MTESVTVRPSPGEPRPYRFPRFERQRVAGGVEVVSAHVAKLPLVSIVALIDAGAERDPAGREGLAVLTAKLLMEGTAEHDGAVLADAFEQLGASVDVTAGWDAALVRLTVLASHVEPAVQLLSEVLQAPAFRERDVMRLKAERAGELLQMRADPRQLADEAFERFLYSAASRYGHPQGGGAAAVGAMTRTDVERFYRGHYVPERLSIVVVGDLTHERATSMIATAFGGWAGTAVETPQLTDDLAETARRVRVVAKPDAPQSELRIGHRGVPRSHPDHFPLVVMNGVLGGFFSSRINLNLREEHAYTYGAHSGFDWRRHAGPFVISTAVESGVTADATREVVKELDRIRETPITAEELSLATSYLEGVFPIRYETTAAIADALAALVTYGFAADYFDTYRPKIAAVTREDVLRVARAHLHPDQLLVLAVGDAAVVEAPLARLALGPVVVSGSDEPDVGA
ncbi:MAG TPA: pitrilysin family protein [Gemmatimonadaceae bacterium]|nr:pitrilysin family protein [Gemmatimonadaceae bacterium]